jgi:hypothetical protein
MDLTCPADPDQNENTSTLRLNRDGNFAILLILRNKSLEAAFNTTALSFFPQDYQSICGCVTWRRPVTSSTSSPGVRQ